MEYHTHGGVSGMTGVREHLVVMHGTTVSDLNAIRGFIDMNRYHLQMHERFGEGKQEELTQSLADGMKDSLPTGWVAVSEEQQQAIAAVVTEAINAGLPLPWWTLPLWAKSGRDRPSDPPDTR